MASFDICYPFLLSNEDYTPPRYEIIPDPTKDDPNAKAISGINSHFWPSQFAAIAALPAEERGPAVKAFYEENFWNKWLDQVDSNRVAAMILDASVNPGPGLAVRFAQTAAGLTESAVDGHWGPITLAAINNAPETEFMARFIHARAARYQEIGGDYTSAWLKRAGRLPVSV